ncbi:hypothetical protein ACFLXJ_07140, partial [Chloroflexota bacterium]
LEEAKAGDRRVDRTIDRIIASINKSLTEKYWHDESHLISKYGSKVFSYERLAIIKMNLYTKLWERRGGPTSEQQQAINAFEEVIPELVNADQLLAEIALGEAHDTSPPENHRKARSYQSALTKADKYFERALSYINKDRPIWAIKYFEKSWEYSQQAIKLGQ